MSERGVFAVDRAVFDHPIFAREPFTEREAWLWMVGQAAWKDTRARVGRAVINLKRGQLAFATRFLATKWGWESDARVRRFLNRLKTDAMIEVLATRDATHITICNYDKWAFGRRTDDAQTDAPTDELPTHQRRKEEEPKNLKTNTSSLRSESARADRGTRLPEGWKPADGEWAVSFFGSRQKAADELPKFCDHWKQQPGQKGVKLDWEAAWRNWCRRSAEMSFGKHPQQGAPASLAKPPEGKTYIMRESSDWPAYAALWRQERGKDPPVDSRGGWLFPKEYERTSRSMQEAAE